MPLHLAPVAPGPDLTARLAAPHWHTTILSRPGDARLVIRYTAAEQSGAAATSLSLSIVGKFFADGTGQGTYVAMQRLVERLAAQPGLTTLAIPRPLAYDPVQRLLLMEWVGGTPYPALLDQSDDPDHCRRVGRALAELHGLPVPGGHPRTMAEHLAELIRPHPLALAEALPSHAERIRRLVTSLLARADNEADQVAPACVHRDVHLRQLFAWRSRVWLIDWDLSAIGDPALDVGNFLVYLATHLGDRARPASRAFLRGYAAPDPAAFARRVARYQALTYLRLACKSYRRREGDWSTRLLAMLRAGEACLETEGIHGID